MPNQFVLVKNILDKSFSIWKNLSIGEEKNIHFHWKKTKLVAIFHVSAGDTTNWPTPNESLSFLAAGTNFHKSGMIRSKVLGVDGWSWDTRYMNILIHLEGVHLPTYSALLATHHSQPKGDWSIHEIVIRDFRKVFNLYSFICISICMSSIDKK
jgi:hypothetical protein